MQRKINVLIGTISFAFGTFAGAFGYIALSAISFAR